MLMNFPYPDPTTQPLPCGIKLTDQGTGWTCTTHDIDKGVGYADGNKFEIGRMVDDIVVHVGERTTVAAMQCLLLEIAAQAKIMEGNSHD
jgi:hypothetical protein